VRAHAPRDITVAQRRHECVEKVRALPGKICQETTSPAQTTKNSPLSKMCRDANPLTAQSMRLPMQIERISSNDMPIKGGQMLPANH